MLSWQCGDECVTSGDLMHTALQVAAPDWSSCFCVDAVQSRATRRAFLSRYADTDVRILAAHVPAPRNGRVVTTHEWWRFALDDA